MDTKNKNWRIELRKIDQKNCPQRQDSLFHQMRDLHAIANTFGFYDAADYIRKTFLKNTL
jgi:hypothetical protein